DGVDVRRRAAVVRDIGEILTHRGDVARRVRRRSERVPEELVCRRVRKDPAPVIKQDPRAMPAHGATRRGRPHGHRAPRPRADDAVRNAVAVGPERTRRCDDEKHHEQRAHRSHTTLHERTPIPTQSALRAETKAPYNPKNFFARAQASFASFARCASRSGSWTKPCSAPLYTTTVAPSASRSLPSCTGTYGSLSPMISMQWVAPRSARRSMGSACVFDFHCFGTRIIP